MSYVLKLSYKDAMNIITDLLVDMSDRQNISYQTTTQWGVNKSGIFRDENTGSPDSVMIGIKDLQPNSSLSFLNNLQLVSDRKFAQVILNVFHEATHYEQQMITFQKDNPTQNDINQALSDLACRGNENYYLYSGNYYRNPNEVQAEYQGVMSTYDYLCKTFPDVSKQYHKQIILDVVNSKVQVGSYFIGIENDETKVVYKTLLEVERDFEIRLPQSHWL